MWLGQNQEWGWRWPYYMRPAEMGNQKKNGTIQLEEKTNHTGSNWDHIWVNLSKKKQHISCGTCLIRPFLDLITAKKQSRFSVEKCDRRYAIKESGVRSWRPASAKKNRMRTQDSSKPKNHNYRKRPNRRHHWYLTLFTTWYIIQKSQLCNVIK